MHADEGMWLFNNPPRKQLKEKYGFEPTSAWLEHVQKSSVRFNSGGSGSFVSADGLVMTNHHVGADALQKMGDKDHNYLRDGFYAKTQERRTQMPGPRAERSHEHRGRDQRGLMAAVTKDMSVERGAAGPPQDHGRDREGMHRTKPACAATWSHFIRAACTTSIATRNIPTCAWCSLPNSKSPSSAAIRTTSNIPATISTSASSASTRTASPPKIEHYLKWSTAGAAENELVFVSGHPGRTNRLATVDELAISARQGYPYLLQRLNRLEVMLSAFSGRSEENARQATEDFFSVQNSRKARDGGLAGLLDPPVMDRKSEAEKKLQAADRARRPNGRKCLAAWAKIAEAEKTPGQLICKPSRMLEAAPASARLTSHTAATLVRAAAEKAKPNGDRLREFRDSNLESLKLQLFSDEPIYPEFERCQLADGADLPGRGTGLSTTGWSSRCWRASRRRSGPPSWSRAPSSGTWPYRKNSTKAAQGRRCAATDPMILLAKLVDRRGPRGTQGHGDEVEKSKRQA